MRWDSKHTTLFIETHGRRFMKALFPTSLIDSPIGRLVTTQELRETKMHFLRASMLSSTAQQTSQSERERKRKRDDDSQAKDLTKPPALRRASDDEAKPDPELNDVVENDKVFQFSDKVGCVLGNLGRFSELNVGSELQGQLDDVQLTHVHEKKPVASLLEMRQAPTLRHPNEPAILTGQSHQQQPTPTPDPALKNTKGDQVEGLPPAINPTSVECMSMIRTMNATSPVNDTSSPATQKQPDIIVEGQPPDDMNEPVEQESHAMRLWTGVGRWLLLLASLAIFIALRHVSGRSRQMTSASILKPVLPPCFLSSAREESEDEGAILGWCDNSTGPDPCPRGGICSEGELRSCMGSYHRVSENGDQCVLSATSNKTIASVEAILANWTAKHYCALTGHGWGITVDVSAPSFELSQIVENVNVVTRLLLTSNSFDVHSDKNGMIVIALTEEYIQAHSVIPCACRFRITVIQFLEYIEKPMLRVMFSIWFILKSLPLTSFLFCAMLAVCCCRRN